MFQKESPLYLPRMITLISIIIYLGIALILIVIIPYFSLSYSLLWGWLLGAVINMINYGLIFVQANRLQLSIANQLPTTTRSGYMVGRLLLSSLGFLMAVLIKGSEGQEIFNIFSVFAAYLVISIVIFITGANYRVKRTLE
jgi:hypothetical protein